MFMGDLLWSGAVPSPGDKWLPQNASLEFFLTPYPSSRSLFFHFCSIKKTFVTLQEASLFHIWIPPKTDKHKEVLRHYLNSKKFYQNELGNRYANAVTYLREST